MTATTRVRERALDGPVLPARPPLDAVSFLTVFLVLLVGIPTDRTIVALGSLGSPALLWAILGGLWWCWHQLQRSTAPEGKTFTPVRIAALAYLAAVMISYIGAMFRGLPSTESSPADTGLIRVFAGIGLVLLVSDGIPNYERLVTLIRRIAVVGSLLALLGLLQFATRQPLTDWISIPGLGTADASVLQSRAGFARPSGTATHPLEYGYVLAVTLPLALTLAIWDATRVAVARWTPAALIAFAAVLAVSRATILGLGIGVLVLLPTWPARVRAFAIAGVVGMLAVVYFVVPGMGGAVSAMFGGISTGDSSAESRIGSYELVAQFVSFSPVIGRGVGTFLPEYRILDNQLLQSAIEVGVLGVVALLALSATAFATTMFARGAGGLEKRVGQGIAAAIAVGTVLMGTYDVFSFTMSAQLYFLVIGLAAAHVRLRGIARQGSAGTEAAGAEAWGDRLR
jgi:O-antigen ligase